MFKITTFVAAIGLAVLNVNAAGFDCAKASTLVEKQICANSEISGLDSKLSDVYRKIAGHDGVKQSQRDWIRNVRNKATGNDAIMIAVYKQRINELESINAEQVAPAKIEQPAPVERTNQLSDLNINMDANPTIIGLKLGAKIDYNECTQFANNGMEGYTLAGCNKKYQSKMAEINEISVKAKNRLNDYVESTRREREQNEIRSQQLHDELNAKIPILLKNAKTYPRFTTNKVGDLEISVTYDRGWGYEFTFNKPVQYAIDWTNENNIKGIGYNKHEMKTVLTDTDINIEIDKPFEASNFDILNDTLQRPFMESIVVYADGLPVAILTIKDIKRLAKPRTYD